MEFENLDILDKYIKAQELTLYKMKDGEFTHIYDFLNKVIRNVNEKDNISMTTFVLCTYGNDFASKIKKLTI